MTKTRLLWEEKRLVGGLLIVLLGLSIAGCSGEPATSPAEGDPEDAAVEDNEAEDEQDEGAGGGEDMVGTSGSSDVVWAADGVIVADEYSNSLDQGTYKLYWSSTEDTIRVAMQATAEGWVALGLQPGQRMKDADVILGMVVDGEALVLDSYSSGDFGPHKADSEFGGTDDVVVAEGTESGGTTTIEFERALDTGDSYDIALERGVAIGIIWAYGSTDDEGQRHSTRGYGEIVP